MLQCTENTKARDSNDAFLRLSLQVKEDGTGNVKIASSNAGKDFAAEEISAQVLRKLTDDAAKFLGDKVCHVHLQILIFPLRFVIAIEVHIVINSDLIRVCLHDYHGCLESFCLIWKQGSSL